MTKYVDLLNLCAAHARCNDDVLSDKTLLKKFTGLSKNKHLKFLEYWKENRLLHIKHT